MEFHLRSFHHLNLPVQVTDWTSINNNWTFTLLTHMNFLLETHQVKRDFLIVP